MPIALAFLIVRGALFQSLVESPMNVFKVFGSLKFSDVTLFPLESEVHCGYTSWHEYVFTIISFNAVAGKVF